MTAFARALTVLHADANMGSDVLWRAADEGAGVLLRAILTRPSESTSLFGQEINLPRLRADVPVVAAPTMAQGDTLEIGGVRHPVRDVPELDELQLTWRLNLGPAE